MDKQREEFEAWAVSKNISIERDGFGGYSSHWTDGALEGWQAAQAAQPAQPGWRSIESEPQDFASRLYLVNGFCVQGFVDAAGILCAQNDRQPWRKMHGKPTHWMPLPPLAAPSTKEQTE